MSTGEYTGAIYTEKILARMAKVYSPESLVMKMEYTPEYPVFQGLEWGSNG